MPPFDPKRYPFAKLVNPEHKLPWKKRLFGENAEHPGFERVDIQHSHTWMLIHGGSIMLADPPEPAAKD